ncbi:MAG: YidC/Oxa1 family insertase periplasmic-domain containing protein [Planctomycetaceae bacterium]
MKDQNLIKFFIASLILSVFWVAFGEQLGLRPPAKKPDKNQQKIVAPDEQKPAEGAETEATSEEKEGAAEEKQPEATTPEVEEEFVQNEHRLLKLGTLKEDAPYYLEVELDSQGAVVSGAWLNDPRYKEVSDQTEALKILGADTGTVRKSFELSMKQIDDQLARHNTNLNEVDWKVVNEVEDPDAKVLKEVTFQYTALDKSLVLEKTYSLKPVEVEQGKQPFSQEARDTQPGGYLLHVAFKVQNNQEAPVTVEYQALGPVGIPLENEISTYKYRDIKFQSEMEEGDLEGSTIPAKKIFEGKVEPWTNYMSFIGVDVQYFATLVMPEDNRPFQERISNRWIKEYSPLALNENPENSNLTDISFMMHSEPTSVKPGDDLVHQFQVYLGPKRDELLEPIKAEYVAEVWSWISWLSKPMMGLMTKLHDSLGFPYWLAIICLTIIVRGILHPLTRKQAASAKRMKEFQPKLQELKKKYGNDREKLGQAQMQLYRDHNFNPFAGCLPVFLQMPIFIALYQGLRSTLDLRLANFLWIDNLAAPDMLFDMGVDLPFIRNYFNLLPVLTVCLFIVQNKMLMPQPDPTDEMAVQTQKMMKFMMIFMGFMFYHVPSGLCIYFITSSIWSLCERKLIDFQHNSQPAPEIIENSAAATTSTNKGSYPSNGNKGPEKQPGKVGGMWNRLLEAAEAQKQLQREETAKNRNQMSGKKKKKR